MLLRVVSAFCAFAVLMSAAPRPVFAQEPNVQELPTPSRIGMVSGTASFWRPGAENWSPAQVNTALAAGDALYTAAAATLEVQVGARAYVRMAQNTMLTLLGNEPGLQQFKVTSGIAAFDLRGLPAGRSVEIDTPSAAFNIDSAGYYRLEITDSTTHFVVRRGGEATVTLPDGDSRLIAPSQEAVIEAGGDGNVETYVAPDTDTWDQWNYTRTDDLTEAISNRYVSPEVYGTDDLDHNGNWRVTPDYGPVWVPNGMAPDWAPYSSGSWVWDPVYAWTWVDTAPWGWAPYHYGRWVNISGFWAWAPGPRHHHPIYAPALVAFFNGSGGGLQIGFGGAAVSWVALGWGEPCLPWWGQRSFVGRPWWGGWAGPRVVNNVVIQHNTVINNITNIRYRNINQHNAVIAIPEKEFGHGHIADIRHIEAAHIKDLRPIAGQHPMRPEAVSLAPSAVKSIMPAANVLNRPAVGLHRPPQRWRPLQAERQDNKLQAQQQSSPDKLITVRPQQTGQKTPWARFGQSAGPERNEPRRAPDPPRVETWLPQVPLPQLRQESSTTKPSVPEQARPMPQQQQPSRIIEAPQVQRREQEPARIITVPPPAPVIMQREAPRMPVVASPQAEHSMSPRHEQAPQNAKPEKTTPMPLGEMRQMRREHVERPLESRQQEAPASLPGEPANKLYPRRFQRSEQQR
ncbi:DUF6600 domain-containing protein [Georgfuchsia toluolica]|uniref:DUF6600 domain-containing protein n=1 Tax=Georgfuchsia toluolica TaxID=424218 RepID=UPI001C730298|nr:DUF6600 domain-containing protein [Georgfuchsia toluolica]